ncbi:MAG: ECF transporter S component [Candidatus Bathyarchaeia archaeon]
MKQKTPVPISRTRIVALISVLAALIAVGTVIAIPMPTPLAAITLAPIIIFVTSILLGPAAGLISTVIGSAIGYSFGSTLGTISGGFSYWFLFGIVVARGPMGLTVGLLRKKNEIIAMIFGVAVETLLFFGLDFYAFGFGTAILDFGTLVDLVFVPVTYGILVAVRRNLDITYLA